jgi:hypothetical protein
MAPLAYFPSASYAAFCPVGRVRAFPSFMCVCVFIMHVRTSLCVPPDIDAARLAQEEADRHAYAQLMRNQEQRQAEEAERRLAAELSLPDVVAAVPLENAQQAAAAAAAAAADEKGHGCAIDESHGMDLIFCQECNAYLCRTCDTAFHKGKMSKHGRFETTVMRCEWQEDCPNPATFECETCGMLCKDCDAASHVSTGHNRHHPRRTRLSRVRRHRRVLRVVACVIRRVHLIGFTWLNGTLSVIVCWFRCWQPKVLIIKEGPSEVIDAAGQPVATPESAPLVDLPLTAQCWERFKSCFCADADAVDESEPHTMEVRASTCICVCGVRQ